MAAIKRTEIEIWSLDRIGVAMETGMLPWCNRFLTPSTDVERSDSEEVPRHMYMYFMSCCEESNYHFTVMPLLYMIHIHSM